MATEASAQGGTTGVNVDGVLVNSVPAAPTSGQSIRQVMTLGSSDGSATYLDPTTKATQPTEFMPTQDAKDSGRNPMVATGGSVVTATALTLLSLNYILGATPTAESSYQVSAGKRLRIQGVGVVFQNNNTTDATAQAWLVVSASGAVTAASTQWIFLGAYSGADQSDGHAFYKAIPDGLEIPAGYNIGIVAQVGAAGQSVTVTPNIIAYEY